ncbi:cobalt-precorrin-6A reductase [Fortiea contorta]|uniref:cobalt-precorrin-6A reductase n=1 Tax=Fortiea contorta TaxID=1892405 RepID=UPI00034BC89F|nr:cobalt-precorrin-6A reductase [Fortiea contorta]
MRVLILGGTGDAAELAARVAAIPGVEGITSLAGRTREPSIPSGNFRIGGFGGVSGLASYLGQMQIDLLIDATHPFATQISENAAEATAEIGLPRLMLIRRPWEQVKGDRWLEVENTEAAAAVLSPSAHRVFLTVGRQELSSFAHLQDIWFLMRVVDPPHPDAVMPPGLILCDRGPFALNQEREILKYHKIDTIVSKNSGGDATYAKIIAARELGLQVVMINRPPKPPGEQVTDVEGALGWLLAKLGKQLETKGIGDRG